MQNTMTYFPCGNIIKRKLRLRVHHKFKCICGAYLINTDKHTPVILYCTTQRCDHIAQNKFRKSLYAHKSINSSNYSHHYDLLYSIRYQSLTALGI